MKDNKYLILCTRHDSIYGDNWCLWWGYKDSKNGYSSDIRTAHRFTEEEIEQFKNDKEDIPIEINKLGISDNYEENINENFVQLIEKGTLNKLYDLKLSR